MAVLSRRGVLGLVTLVTLAHRPSFSEKPKSQMMGLPAIVQQPFSMTEVETKAAAEAIFASSSLAMCVDPSFGQKKPRHRIQTSRLAGNYTNCLQSRGWASECARLDCWPNW
ncbi:exported hypothetical protein [Mesorhizobium sp. ORS 3359]|nr:exported hypothetical protein [Mesorhizobium sp. ORS 3359]